MAAEHAIGPPDPDKQPLKTNLFEHLRTACCTLAPLFPYLDQGAIVPAGTLFRNGPGARWGFFEHTNDVDEVFVCFASHECRIPPASVRVGPRRHFVGTPFKEGAAEDGFAVIAIVQRQSTGRQTEQVSFPCVQCHAPLLVRTFDATPAPRGQQERALGPHAPFETLVQSLAAYEAFNASDRTCPKCGTVNPPFPIERWGQDEYVARTEAIRAARAQHERLAGESR